MTDPDATPAEKFEAWLREQEAAGAMRRPRRPPCRFDRPILAAGYAVWAAFLGVIGWRIGQAAGWW